MRYRCPVCGERWKGRHFVTCPACGEFLPRSATLNPWSEAAKMIVGATAIALLIFIWLKARDGAWVDHADILFGAMLLAVICVVLLLIARR